jgi:hypothetical protein
MRFTVTNSSVYGGIIIQVFMGYIIDEFFLDNRVSNCNDDACFDFIFLHLFFFFFFAFIILSL